MSNFITFGQRLQTLRKEHGMSRTAFAVHLGVPQPTLYTYEKGICEPSMSRLIGIAQKCEVSIDWLCGLTETRSFAEEVEQFSLVLQSMILEENEWDAISHLEWCPAL